MGSDIRIPIGLMFAVIGCILAIEGFLFPAASHRTASDINVNLIWGAVLMGFSAIMLYYGRRSLK